MRLERTSGKRAGKGLHRRFLAFSSCDLVCVVSFVTGERVSIYVCCLLFVFCIAFCIFSINTKNSTEKAGGKSLGRVLEEFSYFHVFVNSSMVISSNSWREALPKP